MTKFFLALALLICAPAWGATTYYARCDAGSHTGCVPGDDGNDGLTPSTPKATPPTVTQLNAANCGDQFLFARGSRWNEWSITGGQWAHAKSCETNHVVFGDYSHPSNPLAALSMPRTAADGGDLTVFPTFTHTGDSTQFSMANYFDCTPGGGYTIRGIRMIGASTDSSLGGGGTGGNVGFFFGGAMHDILLDGVYITRFNFGIENRTPNVDSCGASFVGKTPIQRQVIRNSVIYKAYSQGILGAPSNSLFENNVIEEVNYQGAGGNHSLYMSSGDGSTVVRNLVVRGNRIIRSSVRNVEHGGDGLTCILGNITFRGPLVGLVIENNTITQDQSSDVCYGITINHGYTFEEYFENVIVRGNTVVNLGGCFICYQGAQGIIIENNELVDLQAGPRAYQGMIAKLDGADRQETGVVVRNNSIYLHSGWAINTSLPGTPGSANVVANNLIYYWGASGTRRPFNHLPKANYSSYDNNLVFGATGFSETYLTLGDENNDCPSGAASFDCNGLRSDPLITAPSSGNGYGIRIGAGSPAIAAGNNANCPRLTKTGRLRTGNCTIGARQLGIDP